jgi:hypothetical protein
MALHTILKTKRCCSGSSFSLARMLWMEAIAIRTQAFWLTRRRTHGVRRRGAPLCKPLARTLRSSPPASLATAAAHVREHSASHPNGALSVNIAVCLLWSLGVPASSCNMRAGGRLVVSKPPDGPDSPRPQMRAAIRMVGSPPPSKCEEWVRRAGDRSQPASMRIEAVESLASE